MAKPFVTSDDDVIDSASTFDTSVPVENVAVEDVVATKIEREIVEPAGVSAKTDPYAVRPGHTTAAYHNAPPVYVTTEHSAPHVAPATTYVSQPYANQPYNQQYVSQPNASQYPAPYPTQSYYPTRTSGLDGWAIAALACAAAGLIGIAPFIGSILGIVFGILGLNRSHHLVDGNGRGMSIAGIVIGAIGLLLAMLVLVLGLIAISGYNSGRIFW